MTLVAAVRRRTASFALGCCAYLLMLLLGVSCALCQSTSTGTVSGTVTDQSGAVVPGATVSLVDKSTNAVTTAATNDAGRYVFVNVNPGTYDVKVTKQGFELSIVPNQTVTVGTALTENIKLTIGAVSQEVTVESTGAELQTLNATVGTTVSGRSLIELPNLGRDATTLAILQPATGPLGNIAGTIADQNSFQLDGGNNTNDMDGTMNIYTPSFSSDPSGVNGTAGGGGASTGVMPTPVESIEEFKVSSNNQTADFNGSAGGQIQMVTKRGTSSFHGAAYEYYQGSNFGANTWDNDNAGLPKPSQHQNRFGLAAGGPVLPNFLGGKTYLFGDYEGRRFPDQTTLNRPDPTATMRAGVIFLGGQVYNLNPTAVTVNGVTYPAQPGLCPQAASASNPQGFCDPRMLGVNSIVSQVWKQMPLPNNLTPGVTPHADGLNIATFSGTLSLPQNDNFGVARLDHDFGDKFHFMSSYRYYHLDRATNNQTDIAGGTIVATANRPQVPWFYVAGLTTNITSNTTNDFHYSYLRNFWNWGDAAAPPQLPGLGGAIEVGGESTNTSIIPYNVNTQQTRQRFWDGQDNMLRDDITMLKGNHLLTFGGTYERNWDYHQRNDNGVGIQAATVYQINGGAGTPYNGSNMVPFQPAGVSSTADYNRLYTEILGLTSQPQVMYSRAGTNLALQPIGTPLFDQSTIPYYNVYFSDSWHMKPNFTLTYGLGYQIEMPPYEQNGKQVELVDGAGNLINTEDFLAQDKANALQGQPYAPEIGFATVRNVGNGLKYPYNTFYGAFSPRIAAAWNPHFAEGSWMGKIFGADKTVIRGGYSRIYGRLNGVDLVLVPLLGTGLAQAVSCIGATSSAAAAAANGGNPCLGSAVTPVTGFRIGTDGLTAPLPAVSATLAQPYFPGVGANAPAGQGSVLDPNFKPNRSDVFDVTIQRELSNKIIMEVGYIGRIIRNEYQTYDLDAVPYMMTMGGQSFANAYANVEVALGCATSYAACGAAVPSSPAALKTYANSFTPQPFFEAALKGTGYCNGFASCTAAVVNNEAGNLQAQAVYDLWSDLQNGGSFNFGRTMLSSVNPACAGASTPGCISAQTSGVFMNASNGYGNYNAGFVSLNLRDWHGLTMGTNLTFSKSLGTGGVVQATSGLTVVDPFNLHAGYGLQNWDQKYTYNLYFSYSPIAYRQQQGMIGHVLGGWTFSPIVTAQSGIPLSVNTANGSCESFGEGSCSTESGPPGENAVRIGNPGPTGIYKQSDGTLNFFKDPSQAMAAFRPEILGIDNVGNADSGGAGVIRGLANWSFDLSVSKDTMITEKIGAQFFWLTTNVFNHPRLCDPGLSVASAGPSGNCGSDTLGFDNPSQFGLITGQQNFPRQMEFGLRLHW